MPLDPTYIATRAEIEVKWVDTKDNLSDILTKGTFTPEHFEELKGGLMRSSP